jgi:hypothetical protein
MGEHEMTKVLFVLIFVATYMAFDNVTVWKCFMRPSDPPAELRPIVEPGHLTDWSGLSGGATGDAKPVKTIIVPGGSLSDATMPGAYAPLSSDFIPAPGVK